MNAYQKLATSIVLRAVEDYRLALRGIPINKDTTPAYTLRECTTFFRSQWFKILCSIDGEFIMRKLKEELNESKTCTSNT